MGGLHWWDLAPLLLLALLFFGPKRLPEMGASVGKTIKAFQRSMKDEANAIETPATPAVPQLAQPAPSATQPVEQPVAQPEPAVAVGEESLG